MKPSVSTTLRHTCVQQRLRDSREPHRRRRAYTHGIVVHHLYPIVYYYNCKDVSHARSHSSFVSSVFPPFFLCSRNRGNTGGPTGPMAQRTDFSVPISSTFLLFYCSRCASFLLSLYCHTERLCRLHCISYSPPHIFPKEKRLSSSREQKKKGW